MEKPEDNSKVAVIVGGGVAGTSCAIHLNALSPSTKIVLIDPRPSLKLCQTLTQLSHTTLDTEISEADAESWCNERNITFLRNRATTLSSTHVTVENGIQVPFQTCCISSGARPFIPVALRDPEFAHCVLTLRDTDSVQRLRQRLGSARRVIVVGAGGIGMEVVHEITECNVIWVVKSSHIGGLFFDNRIASFVHDMQQKQQKKKSVKEIHSENLAHTDKVTPGPHVHVTKYNDSCNTIQRPTSVNSEDSNASVSAAAVGPDWLGCRERAILFDSTGKPITSSDSRQKESRQRNSSTTFMKPSKSAINPILRIMTECEVEKLQVDPSGTWPVIANLSDGTNVGCDVIISGTGVTANIEWLNNCRVTTTYNETDDSTAGGISVNAGEMQTNVNGIFSAGDCTDVVVEADVDWVQMRTWGQALAGGRAAANGMARHLGVNEEDVGMGMEFELFAHSTQFFGCRVVLLGRWKAQGLAEGFKILERQGEKSFTRVVMQNGRVKGAVLAGDVNNAEVFENLIVGQMDVEWMGDDLVNESVELDNFFD